MLHAYDALRDEHQNLWRIAATMNLIADDLERGEKVERAFFGTLFDYLEAFQNDYHHGKEEQHLFPALLRRYAGAAELVARLEQEHAQDPERLAALRILAADESLPLQQNPPFIQELRNYARAMRRHIGTEEAEIMPVARRILSDDDWAAINAALEDAQDPVFGEQARAQHRELYHGIVTLAPESLGLGGSDAGAFRHLSAQAAQVPVLQVRGMASSYGQIQALKGIDLEVRRGELVALIGANGAGKTTFLRTLSGVQPLAGGTIAFNGEDISRLRADKRVQLGICHSPEGRQVFGPLSIEDNLRLGAYARRRDQTEKNLERVYQMFPVLREKRKLPAGTLSGGQQQMLAISRALMGRPRLLLLDEPSMGLAPLLVEEVFNVIKALKAEGITILLVEQNAFAALQIADRAYVLETGHVVLSGSGREMLQNDQVREAYLGM